MQNGGGGKGECVCREKKKGVIEKDWGNERNIKEGGKRQKNKSRMAEMENDGSERGGEEGAE